MCVCVCVCACLCVCGRQTHTKKWEEAVVTEPIRLFELHTRWTTAESERVNRAQIKKVNMIFFKKAK